MVPEKARLNGCCCCVVCVRSVVCVSVCLLDCRQGQLLVCCCCVVVCIHSVVCLLDCRRGQSLVVHAINEGRQAARQIDIDLMGHTSLAFTGGVVTSTRTAEDLWSRPVQYDIDTA